MSDGTMLSEDREVMAAEYVLGTLDANERAQAEALLASDSEFAARVRHWENYLGALIANVEPVEPRRDLFPRIRAMIGGGGGAQIIDLTRRLNRWRGAAVAASALAASLLLFVGLRDFAPDYLPAALRPDGQRFVAVIQQSKDAPAFLLTVDTRNRSFTVRKVGAEPPPGRAYELWLVHDKFPAPRSLGVISEQEFTRPAAFAEYDPKIINEATYAVSIEPPGGSPTGQATGPIVFTGRLIEAER
jgi:anti-sigma-K factor RskA